MTYLTSFTRFVVVFFTLMGVSWATPAGWIALKYVPAVGEEKVYWVLVKEPAEGLASWWSDEELAKIIAGDEDFIQHLETDWTPEDHPVADAAEATSLAEELAAYWDGDLPQANFWGHGALTRRGDTPQAFRWEEDGLTQRAELENEGSRPKVAVAPIDPNPVDPRYDNSEDIVAYGDSWGSHLQTDTLTHINKAERDRLRQQHHPSSPLAGSVAEATRSKVEACREASLQAELGVFENYCSRVGRPRCQERDLRVPGELCVGNGSTASGGAASGR